MAEPRQPQPPPAESTPAQRAAAIAGVLTAAGTAGAAGAALAGPPILTAAVLAGITKLLVRWGVRRETTKHVLRVTARVIRTQAPPTPPTPPGPAELANNRVEPVFRAWFLERTMERVEKAYAEGAADGDPEAREERFIDQHLDAIDARREAARKVDAEADKPGNVTDKPEDGRTILLWRAHPDDKVTPECRAADGAWFYADTPPIIGYPGMPHGGTCRCWPAHAVSLAAVARGRHVNEAVHAIIGADTQHRPHPSARPERTAS